MYLRAGISMLFGIVVLATLFISTSATAQQCPTNTVPATEDDLPGMIAAGITNPRVGTCWRKGDQFSGEEAAAAKAFLLSRYEIGPRSAPCIKTKEQGIGGLNADFAIRVARLIQDMEREIGGRNIVRSALRPQQCGGGIGHSHGCAVDIEWAHSGGWRPASDNPNVIESQWVMRNGGDTKYRIHHPFRYAPEWHHIEPMDRASCLAGRPIDPSVGGTSTSLPSAGFSESVRQWLAPQQQVQAVPGQPAIATQPVSISQNPIGAFNEDPVPTGVSSQINANTNMSTATSAADRLEELAFGPKATSTQTATSVPLVVSSSNATMLVGTYHPSATSVPSQGIISPSQTTFISGDLSWQGDTTISSAPVSGMQAILITIKATLQRLLQYLVPFGGADAVYIGEDHEY